MNNLTEESIKPIFFDPSQRRAGHLQRTALVAVLLLAAMLTVFWASVVAVPLARRLRLAAPKYLRDNPLRTGNAGLPAQSEKPTKVRVTRRSHRRHQTKPTAVPGRADGVVGGFYVDWDQTSLASLRQHGTEMTHLFPGWLHLNADGSNLVITDSDPADLEAKKLALQDHLSVLPLINNFSADANRFDEARLHDLLQSPVKRVSVAQALFDYVQRHGYAGVNIDLETDDEDDRAALTSFVAEIGALFHAHNLLVTTCTQADSPPAEMAAVARSCDFIIPMLYDVHWAGGDAGPIAPRQWTEDELTQLLGTIPANKIVIAVGNYAYDWIKGKPGGKSLSFGEAMLTANESRDAGSDYGILRLDPASTNPTFTYEEDGEQHEVWTLDSVTAYNLMRFARKKGVTGRALWYVGSEDPTLWSFFGKNQVPGNVNALSTVRYGFEIDFEGEGEALDLTALPQVGQRTLTTSADGMITGEHWTKYPTACVVRRSGRQNKEIALTFDDGPDPNWTPAILDALHKANLPATFFVIGINAQHYPDLLRREWDEGHLIGNHSFYHPNLALASAERARLEIDATQRAIQSATMHSTTLFRPPYGIDVEPTTTSEIIPLEEAEKLGYITVGEGLDPRDWQQGKDKQSAEQIAARVLEDAEAHEGNVVLLHDSGGDRTQTIKAIPLIAAELRAKGYRFVSIGELIGDNRARIMPAVTGREKYVALLNRCVFGVTTGIGNLLGGLFLLSLIAGTLRMAVTATLAFVHASREKSYQTDALYTPTVSVVIAAYNEEKVITRTIQALLNGGYPHLEVIVVDDGSKDKTSEVVREAFRDEARVRLITKENGGKASALNRGIAESTGRILIGLDADTLFAQDTVHRLVQHFADESVGAVAGNIQVGNRNNLLTRWQAVEYTTSQNFDRRAYDVLNAIPVVPGCVGAWRADAVRAAGMYQRDTLAEDADLTYRVRKSGWRIVCDNTALAFTEAPERLSDLMKQRFRWTFGTLQVLWKHRDIFANPKYGWFGMAVIPSLLLFQILLPLIAPAADLGILATVFSKNWVAVWAYGAFFFVTELSAAALAFTLDNANKERTHDLALLFLQRFVYRYVMFAVLLRAILAALYGARAGWGKLDRRGTAQVALVPPRP